MFTKRLIEGAQPLAATLWQACARHEGEFLRDPVEPRAIFLRDVPWPRQPEAVADSLVVIAWPALQLVPEFQAGLNALGAVLPGAIARARIVCIRPGEALQCGPEVGAYAEATERFVFTLHGAEQVVLWAGSDGAQGEVLDLALGELWWVDRRAPWGQVNVGEIFALQLWVDCLGGDALRAWLNPPLTPCGNGPIDAPAEAA